MNFRVMLSRTIIRLANWMKALPVLMMTPEALITFTRLSYDERRHVERWSDPKFVGAGLDRDEVNVLEGLPVRTGRLLLLGVGGGREAISLARNGFEVTGIDFVPKMVAHALTNARAHNVEIEGLVQDFSRLEVPQASFDVIWLSRGLYSSVPSPGRRIAMLRRMHRALRPQGCVVCQFMWNPDGAFYSPRGLRLRKIVARALGNRDFEDGDHLHGDREFLHFFSDEKGLRSEFEAGGFWVHGLDIGEDRYTGAAILTMYSARSISQDKQSGSCSTLKIRSWNE